MRFGGRRKLTLSQQLLNLRANPISGGDGEVRQARLVWRCEVSPTALSRMYAIRIEYGPRRRPSVFVEAPDLIELAEGRSLPHVYEQNPTELCLFLPGAGQWAAWKRLDQTVVPWAALWFLYFEDWLRCGVWTGGGMHPDGRRDHYDEDD